MSEPGLPSPPACRPPAESRRHGAGGILVGGAARGLHAADPLPGGRPPGAAGGAPLGRRLHPAGGPGAGPARRAACWPASSRAWARGWPRPSTVGAPAAGHRRPARGRAGRHRRRARRRADRERLFAILKDSRLGTYGVLALMPLPVRPHRDAGRAGRRGRPLAFALAAVLSRAPLVWLMRALPYVTPGRRRPQRRPDPGQPSRPSLAATVADPVGRRDGAVALGVLSWHGGRARRWAPRPGRPAGRLALSSPGRRHHRRFPGRHPAGLRDRGALDPAGRGP